MMKKSASQQGISYVEIILVIATVGFLAMLIGTLPSTISAINQSSHLSRAKDIAGKQVESLRKQTYSNLANGTSNFTDSDLNLLPSSQGSYEIIDCPLVICPNGEKAKQVTVTISWKEPRGIKSAQIVTIIGEGGVGQ